MVNVGDLSYYKRQMGLGYSSAFLDVQHILGLSFLGDPQCLKHRQIIMKHVMKCSSSSPWNDPKQTPSKPMAKKWRFQKKQEIMGYSYNYI